MCGLVAKVRLVWGPGKSGTTIEKIVLSFLCPPQLSPQYLGGKATRWGLGEYKASRDPSGQGMSVYLSAFLKEDRTSSGELIRPQDIGVNSPMGL